jgi:hypothetical protein
MDVNPFPCSIAIHFPYCFPRQTFVASPVSKTLPLITDIMEVPEGMAKSIPLCCFCVEYFE